MMVMLVWHVFVLGPAVVGLLVLVAFIPVPFGALVAVSAIPAFFVRKVAVLRLIKWTPIVSVVAFLSVTICIVHAPVIFSRAHPRIRFSPAAGCVLLLPWPSVPVLVTVVAVAVISIVIILFVSHSFYRFVYYLVYDAR